MPASSRRLVFGFLCVAALSAVAARAVAGPIDLKQLDHDIFDRLSAKAEHNVNINLDGSLLKAAVGMLSDSEDKEAAQLKKLVAGLTSVTVRNLSFKKSGEYTADDLRIIRDQIRTGGWTRIVDVTDKEEGDHSEIYVLPGKEHPTGLFILATEPQELTVVCILGDIDVNNLGALEELGVPDASLEKLRKHD